MEASGGLVGALEGSSGSALGQLQGTEARGQTSEVPGILVPAPGFGLFVGLAGQDLPEAGELVDLRPLGLELLDSLDQLIHLMADPGACLEFCVRGIT